MSAEQEKQALLGLALASLPDEYPEKFRDDAEHGEREEETVRKALFLDKGQEEPPRLGEALRTLGELTNERARVSNRVLPLDLLAKTANRRGIGAFDPVAEELHAFIQTAVDEGDRRAAMDEESELDDEDPPPLGPDVPRLGAEPHENPRVNQVVSALEGAGVVGTEVHHWTAFAIRAKTALHLTDAEVYRPLCTDDQWIDMPGGRKAVRTAVWFWSDKPAVDFAEWTDPRTWDQSCHLFFRSVDTKSGNAIPMSVDEFEETFIETVNINGTDTLSTDLVFKRTVQRPDLFALEFRLPDQLPSDPDIVVDTGQVTVRHDPHAPPGFETVCLAEKYILFADPAYATWPTLACDTFWIEFAITMALKCK